MTSYKKSVSAIFSNGYFLSQKTPYFRMVISYRKKRQDHVPRLIAL